ncbi:MAG: Calx-beta domain-containing protein [Nocardioides sp.]
MNTFRRGRVGMLAAGSIVLSGLVAPGAFAAEPSPASVVTDHADWVEQAYENTPTGAYLEPEQSDVDGPARTPFGTGSHKVRIGQSTVQTELYRTTMYDGMSLADLTRFEYSTFARRTGGPDVLRQPTYLRLNVDRDDDGHGDDSLLFIPANNGVVKNGEWQNWDVDSGKLSVNGDTGAANTVTLAEYTAAHPDATLYNNGADWDGDPADFGAVALVTGGNGGGNSDPQTNGEYFVDRVVIGEDDVDTLFDFGPNVEQAGSVSELTVDPTNLQGWHHQAYNNDVYLNSGQSFVDGPATPPAGGGSLRFALSNDTDSDRVELFRTAQFDGTFVRDLRSLEFSTFQRATGGNATPQQPVYLRLSVDDDGNGTTDNTLFYYPGNNGSVAQSTWQGWEAAEGVWGVNGDQGPTDSITLEQYAVAHPDAKIVKNADGSNPAGGLAFLVGGAGAATQMNGEYFLDDITVGMVDAATGHTTSAKGFDLEPVAPAASIGDARVLEGNRGAELSFPVTLSDPAGRSVSVDYATADGTAVAGSDYKAAIGTLTIPAGETTGVIVVKVLSDKLREGKERMFVNVSSPGYGTVADATGRGTIVNDDTRVGLQLTDASAHRVRVKVDTLPAAPGATVKVFRVVKGDATRVLKTELNKLGRISKVLAARYKPGTTVKFYATVRTEHGVYVSKKVSRTVR